MRATDRPWDASSSRPGCITPKVPAALAFCRRRHRGALLAAMVSCAALLLSAGSTLAYKRLPGNPAWEDSVARAGVPYWVGQSGAPNVGYASTLPAVQAAMATWTSPSCTYLRTQFKGPTQVATWRDDGTNAHAWISFPPEVGNEAIAATVVFPPGSSYIYDSDIMFNTWYPWAVNGNPNAMDIQGIATHELGHYFGLDHVNDPTSVMRPEGGPGQDSISLRYLNQDDTNGICAIYPSGAPRVDGGVPPRRDAGSGGNLTCRQIADCINNCADESCAQDCLNRGCASGQSAMIAFVNCANQAVKGQCKSQCADPSSTACGNCYNQACSAQVQACLADTCGGTPPPRDAGPTGSLSCKEIADCMNGCPGGDQACYQGCFDRGCAVAQGHYQAFDSCAVTAIEGQCKGVCADTGGDACVECYNNACAGEVQACIADTCGGTPPPVDSGRPPPRADAGLPPPLADSGVADGGTIGDDGGGGCAVAPDGPAEGALLVAGLAVVLGLATANRRRRR